MNIAMLLEMAATGTPDRVAITADDRHATYEVLKHRALAAAAEIARSGAPRVVYLGGNDLIFPVTLFGAAFSGVPLVPLNYRLGHDQLTQLMQEQPPGTLIVGDDLEDLVLPDNARTYSIREWDVATDVAGSTFEAAEYDEEKPALLLYTSGTSAAPKAAVLRHRHLSSYILGAVEYGAASDSDAALVTVPPYHIAGVSGVLSNVYAGRRLVYLDRFTPEDWVDIADREGITNAMLVPTMLARIVDYLDRSGRKAPPIHNLAYGGARMPLPVIEGALEQFVETGFVNAYGLTETSSTIAVLGPDDHRAALEPGNDTARERLASAGRLVPGVEVQMRDPEGAVMPRGETGEMWVRGPQVSGEYVGRGTVTDEDGWFPTKDLVRVDADDYLFVIGRVDDTIIRGGENISPAEIEDVILRHPDVIECAVVGIPDEEWGQRIGAAVVSQPGANLESADLIEWLRPLLRSSKTPDNVRIWPELPQTGTGKIVRRKVLEQIVSET